MDTFWIIYLFLGIFIKISFSRGQSEVEVQLLTRKYVEKGSNVVLRCVHNIDPNVLYKVAWLKNDANIGKFFEYIADRTPPFRNFSIPGAQIDWLNSNSEQVALKNIDFDASGLYYCEVTTSTPIYTKPSQDEQIHVILPQVGPPRLSTNRRHYYVGDRLLANCTTVRARPPPHITWLINGKKVDDRYVRQLQPYASIGKNIYRSKTHQQQQQASVNRFDSTKNLRDISGFKIEDNSFDNNNNKPHHFHETQHRHSENVYYPFSQFTNIHETNNHKTYDNKYYDTRKHRYVNEGGISGSTNVNYNSNNNNGGGGGIGAISGITSSSNSKGSSIGSSGMVMNSGPGTRSHRGIMSSSQLNIEISEHHINSHGRMEITCLATIPAHVGIGEEFADYKTYSIKVDVETPTEIMTSTLLPPMSGMAALGNISSYSDGSIHQCPSIIQLIICLVILKF